MGKKKGGKKGNDNDFFAGLSAPTEAAPAMTEEEAEALAEKEAERARKREEKKLRDAEEAREKALNAEKARLAMEARMLKKKGIVLEDEPEPEPEPEPAKKTPESAAEAPPPPPLSFLGRLLLALRPFSPEVLPDAAGLAKLWALAWKVLAVFASAALLDAVDANLRAADPDASAKMDAEDDRKRRTMLWCPETGAWFPRGTRLGEYRDAVRRSEDGEGVERWAKNLKTKSKTYGQWVRAKEGDGWASAPGKLTTRDEDLRDTDVKFFAVWEGKAFECTGWVASHLCTPSAARVLEAVDGPKPLFSLAWDDAQGLTAEMPRKLVQQLERAMAAEAGEAVKGKAPKEKLSRAEKKAKKQSYGR
mmetsp:Transcript_17784/g.52890  ORF Transcript_17784/g.52890 Transcript_17784/m.52890 type:complete len:362 (-) Transcript_17784:28-1113(-)